MIHIPHQITERARKWLLRRLFPYSAPNGMVPANYNRVLEQSKRFESVANFATLKPFFISGAIALLLACLLEHWTYGEAVDPAFDERGFIYYGKIALGWTVLALAWAKHRFTIRWWRDYLPDFYLCTSIRDGYDKRKSGKLLLIVAPIFGLVGSAVFWGNATVIDAREIRFWRRPLGICKRPYEDVREIGLYEQHLSLTGMENDPNLEIVFKDGPPFRLKRSELLIGNTMLDSIAVYVSRKSGVKVTRSSRKMPSNDQVP